MNMNMSIALIGGLVCLTLCIKFSLGGIVFPPTITQIQKLHTEQCQTFTELSVATPCNLSFAHLVGISQNLMVLTHNLKFNS